jgi:hypothetical protein
MADEDDEVGSTSNPRRKTKDEKLQRERDRAKEDFIRASLSTREGRIWFWDLLGRCGVLHNPWTANALVTAFACGEMNIGQEVLADITRLVPDYFATMLKENNNE